MSESAARGRPVIIMQTGPLHLFWTTGVFYFWELKERFDFVLLVPDAYRDSEVFQRLVGLPAVLHVEYEPARLTLSGHKWYAARYPRLLRQYAPHSVLLYNQSYADNLYLVHFCKSHCPSARRYAFQLGRMPVDWHSDFAAARADAVARLVSRHPWLKGLPRTAKGIMVSRNAAGYIVNYTLFPLLVIGKLLHPPLNVYNGRVHRRAMRLATHGPMDYQFVYSEREMKAFDKLGYGNLRLVRHPLSRVGPQVFRFLYGELDVDNAVLILPSYGFTSRLLEQGRTEREVINHVSSRWIEAISALKIRFPTYCLRVKLHPASEGDTLWSGIVEKIASRFDDIALIDPAESAERHIAQANVVVGDVTSALWWASMTGGKIVVSFDIFEYPGGDDMKHDAGIIYLDSVERMTQWGDEPSGQGNYSSPEQLVGDVIQ